MTSLLHTLQGNAGALAVACAALGAMVGSFLNVVVHRLPRMIALREADRCARLRGETPKPRPAYNLAVPRSACPRCGHSITALENVPVLSWLALRGRCRGCKAPISARYPAVEALAGALSGLMAWQFGWGLALAAALLFTWASISLAFIQFDTGELPEAITLPLVWAGLAFNLGAAFVSPGQAVLGAMAGWGVVRVVRWLAARGAGHDLLGRGSPLLGSAAGAFFGLAALPWLLAMWAALGLAGHLALRRGPLPVGPSFAIAGLALLAWHWPAPLPIAG